MSTLHDRAENEQGEPVTASPVTDDTGLPIEPDTIRAQLARILSSPEFKKSHQLGRFLQYVIEETLNGRGDQIKQYTVAVHALGRPTHFDPRADPIVRIEARRLRRSLNRYYQLYGINDPVIIDIPTGAYVPRFRWNEQATKTNNHEISAPNLIHPHAAAIPTLVLLPFDAQLIDDKQRFFADTLGEELAIAFHRFHHLHVIGPIPRDKDLTDAVGPRTLAQRYHADFLFGGRLIQNDDQVKIVVRLIDGLSGKLLWSETYSCEGEGNLLKFGEETIHRIAGTLLDAYGVIPRIFLRRTIRWQEETFRIYQAILQYSRYLIIGNELEEAIRSLEEVVAFAPNNALVKTLLADLYILMFQNGANKTYLKRGEVLAKEALRLDPQNHYAHFVLAFVPYLLKQKDAFIHKMRLAVSRNPFNPVVLASAGVHLGVVGLWEEGFALIKQAMKLNPNFPGWYHVLSCLNAYRQGQYAEALEYANLFNTPQIFWDPLLRAAVLGQLERQEEAQSALNELLALIPDFSHRGRELMLRALFTEELVEMLLLGLNKAGLDRGD